MTAEMTNVNPQARYDIGQTCALLGIHRDTLRKYTDDTHEIECKYRKIGGVIRKFYLGAEILRFWSNSINQSNSDNGN